MASVRGRVRWIGAAAVGCLLWTPSAAQAELPEGAARAGDRAALVVERVEVAPHGRRVVISTSGTPNFSVFRLTSPFRILVDIAGAELAPDAASTPALAGTIVDLTTRAFSGGSQRITRVEITLAGAAEYSARALGHRVILDLEAGADATVAEANGEEPVAVADEAPSSPRIGRLEFDGAGTRAVLSADLAGELSSSSVHMETLSNPARLVIDLLGVQIEPRWQRLRVGVHGVRQARAATRAEGARVVLDLEPGADFPEVAVDVVGAQLQIGIEAAPTPEPMPVAEAAPEPKGSEAPEPRTAPPSALEEALAAEIPSLRASPAAAAKSSEAEPTTEVAAAVEATPAPVDPEIAEATRAPAPQAAAPAPQAAAPAPRAAGPAPQAAAPAPRAAGPAPRAAAPSPQAPAPAPPASALARRADGAGSSKPAVARKVKNVSFEPKDGFYRLTVELDGSAKGVELVRRGTEAAPRLLVSGVSIPKTLERTMDVSAVAGEALTAVSTYAEGQRLVIAARIEDATEHRHWRRGRELMWDFRSSKPRVAVYDNEGTASYGASMARTAGQLAAAKKRYSGRRISLDLKDADIQNVLRLLADVSKLNIVAADEVKGKITIKLRNVPWDQALDIVLRAKQLDKTRNGNIIRVAPLSVLRQEEELRLARMDAQVKLEPLTVRLIPVSYATAADVKPQVEALLTERGNVNVDTRTNVLIVEDISAVLTKVERLVRTLDTQTPQVLIEARIVEARSNFSRELGIQWGGNASFTQNFGNQTGLSFPSNVRIAGGADDQQNQVTEGVLPNANYAVNLPATVGAGGGGALGFVFGSLNGGTLVNLRLSAAEATGKVKIVSAPKVVTLDNKEAKILSGERVPITVITANGPTTRFIDANIELRVIPHVTQDGSILMQIRAKKNELSDRIDFLGVPGILTKEAETQMIVRDGDTAVLGGLYRRNTQENENLVPWLGKIPVLGWLFKTTSRQDARDELLIFISPRIVNRSAALISPE